MVRRLMRHWLVETITIDHLFVTILIINNKYVPMIGNKIEQPVYCTSIFTYLNMNCLCDIHRQELTSIFG